MPGKNGTAEPTILRLGDLTPERKPVAFERSGKAVTLQGYVDSTRCPASVRSEVSAARRVWIDATKYGTDDFADDPGAWMTFVRTTILAVVPGILFDEADVLAGDVEQRRELLEFLGWWKSDDEAEPDPQPVAESLTTGSSSPSSPPSTDPTNG